MQVVPSTFEETLDKSLFSNGAAYARYFAISQSITSCVCILSAHVLVTWYGSPYYQSMMTHPLSCMRSQCFLLVNAAAKNARETALQKAREVASRAWPREQQPQLVIGADTVVELDGCILEKPSNAADAAGMLERWAKNSQP
jgi:hypothetical protein